MNMLITKTTNAIAIGLLNCFIHNVLQWNQMYVIMLKDAYM